MLWKYNYSELEMKYRYPANIIRQYPIGNLPNVICLHMYIYIYIYVTLFNEDAK